MSEKQLTRREIRLLVVLPAVLVVGVYAFFFARPQSALISGVRQQTAIARQKPVSGDELKSIRQQVSLLKEQIKSRAATRQSLILPKQWTSPSGRLDAMAAISSVFDSHSLYIVRTAHVADGPGNSMAPKSLRDFADAVAKEGHSPVPQVWQVDVLGAYGDVLAALRALDRCNAFIVPLGISMDPISEDEPKYRRWSLWFWV